MQRHHNVILQQNHLPLVSSWKWVGNTGPVYYGFSLSDSPPGSPEQAGLSECRRDSKENREPMMGMMSMKRRLSVKISSVSLESSAWQNDSLHILTSAADYRSMNDFLMKKVCAFPRLFLYIKDFSFSHANMFRNGLEYIVTSFMKLSVSYS